MALLCLADISNSARQGHSSPSVKLTLIHEIDKPESKLIQAVSNGWPAILSSLESLLETGEPLDETRRWPKGM